MSEYQYYDFLAVDRQLTKEQQAMLRRLSSRAEITASRFTNDYAWGDFRGDPQRLVEDCFDLHLYMTSWGTRQLMIRLPKKGLDKSDITPFVSEVDWVEARTSGDHLIVDIQRHDEGGGGWVDGTGWLAALAPLRTDVLSGDLRLFYLLWLSAIEAGFLPDDVIEPLAGIGPLSDALEAATEFFGINHDLVSAAAQSEHETPSSEALHGFVAGFDEAKKTDLLARLMKGDPYVETDLMRRALQHCSDRTRARRTVGELRHTAQTISDTRNRGKARS